MYILGPSHYYSAQTIYVTVLLLVFFTSTCVDALSALTHSANMAKPHLAIDISLDIPSDFNRYSEKSHLSFKDINSPSRYINTTTKNLIPGKAFTITLGGFSPGHSYEVQVLLNNAGQPIHNETLSFSTLVQPDTEVRTHLMVIDEDLNSEELLAEYDRYMQQIIDQEKNIQVIPYFIRDDYQEKIQLYYYILENYLTQNLYSIFFIGSNSFFPVEIHLLDENGDYAYSYNYEGLSFYSHYWNNPYQYDTETDRFTVVYGLNTNNTPDKYTSYINNTAMADISIGSFVPTSNIYEEKVRQTLHYLQKLSDYRNHTIHFDSKVLYSDTMWGNGDIERDLSTLPFYTHNVGIVTSHVPDPSYHGPDHLWKNTYLNNLENNSFEIGWLNVHGSPNFHYFGVSSADIESLAQLNTGYISLQSCSTGYYKSPGYLAGTYLNSGNVLAVEANLYVTFYVKTEPSDFHTGYTLFEIAHGKKIGDAVRQHGPMHIGHMLFGDPMLIIGDPRRRFKGGKSSFWPLILPTIINSGNTSISSH